MAALVNPIPTHSSLEWSPSEEKQFNLALAEIGPEEPDWLKKLGSMVPGKTPEQLEKHYEDLIMEFEFIDFDLLLTPDHSKDSDGEDVNVVDLAEPEKDTSAASPDKAPAKTRSRRARKTMTKGVPWTEDEHRLFLMGLNVHGKGKWSKISKNFVITRTPSQVASHAQKFFIRHMANKVKRRPSIHDITSITDPSHVLRRNPPSIYDIIRQTPPLPAPTNNNIYQNSSFSQLNMNNTPAIGHHQFSSSNMTMRGDETPFLLPSQLPPNMYTQHVGYGNYMSNGVVGGSSYNPYMTQGSSGLSYNPYMTQGSSGSSYNPYMTQGSSGSSYNPYMTQGSSGMWYL